MRARLPALLALAITTALLLLPAPAARAEYSCNDCHEGIGGPPVEFNFGVCAHCHHVIDFGPHHDPDDPALVCGNCHTMSGLHYVHHWEEACQECHEPIQHIQGPYIFELYPDHAYTREVVEIRGTNLGDTPGRIRVGKKLYRPGSRKILFWSNTEIRFRLMAYAAWPEGTTRVRNVWVRVGGVRSNKVPLTITQP